MKFSTNTISALMLALPFALAAPPAAAGPTKLANEPLMSLASSGTVKPNLMLVYDDSGSMAYTHTPDYVNDNTTCRSGAKMTATGRACAAGDVPYMTPAFNRQYYNPQLRYRPPVRANGDEFPSQDRNTTGGWTSVTTDGFSLEYKDMLDAAVETTSLVDGFPDLTWCVNDIGCQRNSSGYTYPNDTYKTASTVYGNPYYYTLNVNEYCEDATLKKCVATAVNAAAPNTTYKVPALVRWCNSHELTDCQAKYVGTYRYPRFGDPNRQANWYSTITINYSSTKDTLSIEKVNAYGGSNGAEITNGKITVNGGITTVSERRQVAQQLAQSIVNKAGLSRPYTACMQSASGSVPACSTYGITLAADNILAVVPISCGRNVTNKANCTAVKDGSRSNDELVVDSGTAVTALLQVSGTANNRNNQSTITNLRFGSTALINNLRLAYSASASSVATSIVSTIGNRGTVKAYPGGNAITPACKAATGTGIVCLIAPMNMAGNLVTINVTTPASLVFRTTTPVSDMVPTSVVGFDTGVFVRTDIVPSRDSYPKSADRTDCANNTCSYDEEMTNFANWYAYYKTRNQMMKTAVGLAFQPLDDAFKVGLVGLQKAAGEDRYTNGDQLHAPQPFTGTHRTNWYKVLYEMNANGGTPVRKALHAMGNMYANKGEYKKDKREDQVVQYACQQNFTFITTDGYWNGGTVDGASNNDNKIDATRFCTRESGCFDDSAQGKPSLADVALYWYNGGSNDKSVSLRPDLAKEEGTVAGPNKQLHMRTYALGLGVDGIMTYDPKYDNPNERDPNGDFAKLVRGETKNCPWTRDGVYRWPDPEVDKVELSDTLQSRVDDLWHAAINGGGRYFAASDTQQVVQGLQTALNDITASTGAASSAATSTPNLTNEDNYLFSSTYTTVKWTGNLTMRELNLQTGEVEPLVHWSSSWTVGKKVGPNSDTRAIWYAQPGSTTRKDFKVQAQNGLGATELAWFTGQCKGMLQCGNLTPDNQTLVNRPETVVNWLRGQTQHANDVILREYKVAEKEEIKTGSSALPVVLGDVVSSKPAYLRGARKSYTSTEYSEYKKAHADRDPTVFIAANDGMLHAFDAAGGEELWAYVPRITMKKLPSQAGTGYKSKHQFTVDGSPELADVQIDGEWRTILVAGLNAGGRGYYALDVTDPAAPKPLWEICADSAICSGKLHQPEMGFTFGNPQFGTIKDGKDAQGKDKFRWVVFLTSGYNNIPGQDGVDSGSGKGFLFVVDAKTGEQVKNLGDAAITFGDTGLLTTGSGGTGASGNGQNKVEDPSGFAKITAITANPNTDPLVTYVYGGDNLGQMWRFDFTGDKVQRVRMGNAGPTQPITTRPDVAMCQVDTTADGAGASPTRRAVVFGTGRLLDFGDIEDTDTQAVYVLSDTGEAIGDNDWRGKANFAERTLTETRPYDDRTPTVPRSNQFEIDGDVVNLGGQDGWFFDLDKTKGERVNLDPKIVAGTLSVVTNVPKSSTACAVGGTSYAYHLNVCTGEAVSNDGIAGSILSENAAAVGFIIVRLPSGALKMITTTATGETKTTDVTSANVQDARRTGWRRVRD